MKLVVECMGEGDEDQFGVLKSGTLEKFQGKGSAPSVVHRGLGYIEKEELMRAILVQ